MHFKIFAIIKQLHVKIARYAAPFLELLLRNVCQNYCNTIFISSAITYQ